MKITAIKQQQKRPDRYSIYVDGRFAFGLSENDILRLGLRREQEVTTVELAEFQVSATVGKAYERALSYLGIRPRSEKEVRDYLWRKEYEAAVINQVITKLQTLELLNDTQFAREWISWRQSGRPRSRRKLQQELVQKGVAREVIEAVLADIDDETELAQLKELILRHAHRYDTQEKLMAYLARQGYGYGVIKQALQEHEEGV
ncbi:MAG: RecX family transcriptional regulator [Candidatus Saccharimonadales bacterium]